MRRYIALVQANPGGGFAGRFPDFPQAFSAAKTFDELRDALGGSLAVAIEAMERAGEKLPASSSFEKLMDDPRNADRAAMFVLPRRAGLASRGAGGPADSLHADSNDEWPEADA